MKCLLVLCCAFALAAAQTAPVFPNDWTAYEVDEILQFQGNYQTVGNSLCCPLDSPACQVQIQTQEGQNYYDFTNNRTLMDQGQGQAIADLYNIQKELLVVNGVCQEYCPMQGDTLTPFALDPTAKNVGQKVVNNITTDDWQWQTILFKVVVMETTDVFVNNADPKNPVPVQEVDTLTPFGEFIGTMTSTWTGFTGGPIDPSIFNIQGIDNCPMSNQCDSSKRQLHRLRRKNWQTWFFYRHGGQAKLAQMQAIA